MCVARWSTPVVTCCWKTTEWFIYGRTSKHELICLHFTLRQMTFTLSRNNRCWNVKTLLCYVFMIFSFPSLPQFCFFYSHCINTSHDYLDVKGQGWKLSPSSAVRLTVFHLIFHLNSQQLSWITLIPLLIIFSSLSRQLLSAAKLQQALYNTFRSQSEAFINLRARDSSADIVWKKNKCWRQRDK